MLNYIITFEQLHDDKGALVEYATKSDGLQPKQAMSTFYDKCAAVNKDLSSQGHTFMAIKLMTSQGDILKQDKIGAYVSE